MCFLPFALALPFLSAEFSFGPIVYHDYVHRIYLGCIVPFFPSEFYIVKHEYLD